jgi:putative solute:sodium symporter small subunit
MQHSWKRCQQLTFVLLLVWAAVTFLPAFLAPYLQFSFFGWPFSFWLTAQGALLAYLAIVAIYGWAMNRSEPLVEDAAESQHGSI